MPKAAGWQKYLYIRPEADWGVFDAGGTDLYIPYANYDVAIQRNWVQPELTGGFRQRRYQEPVNARVAGNLVIPVYGQHVDGKSIAQHLLEPTLSAPNGLFLDSFTGRLADPSSDNKRHLGLRVNTCTIAGAAGGSITMSLALEGQTEVAEGSMPSLDHTEPQPASALFRDAILYFSSESQAESASGAGESLAIRSFNLTINNNLQVNHENSDFPTIISNGGRNIDFSFGLFKTDNTYDALMRLGTLTNRVARLVLRAPHLGTAAGTYTLLVFEFDRLNFNGKTNESAFAALEQETVNWLSFKPDTTESELEMVYSLAA